MSIAQRSNVWWWLPGHAAFTEVKLKGAWTGQKGCLVTVEEQWLKKGKKVI